MDDRRRIPRRRAMLGSRILFPDRMRAVNAMTRNYTDTGALVFVDVSVPIPERFGFVLRRDEPPRPARLVWRQGDRAGIAFLAA